MVRYGILGKDGFIVDVIDNLKELSLASSFIPISEDYAKILKKHPLETKEKGLELEEFVI